jgi:hypothetical protein
LLIEGVENNFISCYKPPIENDENFLTELDDFIFTLNLEDNLIIIGDLNMDLLQGNNQNESLLNFILSNNLDQAVTKPTRICTKYYEKEKRYSCSKSLIDVIIHNNGLVKEVFNIHCGFSDHKFIMAKLDIKKTASKQSYFTGRNLSEKSINSIVDEITLIDHNLIKRLKNADEK